MEKNPNRRCSQCRLPFVPDPRVGERQVTCGAPECQRRQHAEACRRWRECNRDATASHYQDVVVPFREKHPGYQRRYRIVQRLREIRDEMLAAVLGAGERLRALLARGRSAQLNSVPEPAQVRAMTGKPLEAALAGAASIAGVLDELAGLVAQLHLGKTS